MYICTHVYIYICVLVVHDMCIIVYARFSKGEAARVYI